MLGSPNRRITELTVDYVLVRIRFHETDFQSHLLELGLLLLEVVREGGSL
jgi:hypothetical protein